MGTLRRWIVANTWAEAIGLGVAGGILALAVAEDASTAVVLAAGVGAGLLEGSIVGVAQARVLRDVLPEVRPARWITMTIVGATIAWVAGSLPAQLIDTGADAAGAPPEDIALWLQLLAAVPLGLLAGPILGGWQALALRGVVDRPRRWVLANALAWGVGMPTVFVGAAGLAGLVSGAGLLVVAVLTALAAGAVVGAVHGRWIVAFERERTAGRGQADVDQATASMISSAMS